MGLAKEAVGVRSRAIWIYLLVAVCLAGIYFFELRQKRIRIAERISSTVMFKVKPLEISSFVISKGGVKIVATRVKEHDSANTNWKITSPIRARADGLRVQQFLEKLSKLRWQRKISEGQENLAQFGLNNPSVVISFQGNNASGTLSIGSQTPFGDDVYVQRNGDKSVYTISFADKFDLDVDLFDLRDKRLITLDPSEITRVTIERNGKDKWVLKKTGDKWLFSDGEHFEASPERVRALLLRLWTMRATSIQEERAEDLSKYGLNRPRVKIQVCGAGQSQELWIGNSAKKQEGLYAKVVHKPLIVTITSWILSDIPTTPEGFRK